MIYEHQLYLVQTWFYDIRSTRFTRILFWTAVFVPLLIFVKVLDPWKLHLKLELVVDNYEIWRIFTSAFVCPLGAKWFVKLYFLGSYSTTLEQETFRYEPADFVFLLIGNWILCAILALYVIPQPILMYSLVNSLVHSWIFRNPDETIRSWMNITCSAKFYAVGLVVYDMMTDSDWRNQAIGIIAAYLFFYVTDQWAQHWGRPFFSTPSILKKIFPSVRRPQAGVPRAEPSNQHFPGTGNHL